MSKITTDIKGFIYPILDVQGTSVMHQKDLIKINSNKNLQQFSELVDNSIHFKRSYNFKIASDNQKLIVLAKLFNTTSSKSLVRIILSEPIGLNQNELSNKFLDSFLSALKRGAKAHIILLDQNKPNIFLELSELLNTTQYSGNIHIYKGNNNCIKVLKDKSNIIPEANSLYIFDDSSYVIKIFRNRGKHLCNFNNKKVAKNLINVFESCLQLAH